MSIYAVGDIQGCYEPLRRLLDTLHFDPAQDQLWCVGDLVNRGPDSLRTLRFLHELGASTRCVLGNHDIHLLAMAAGVIALRAGDTLLEILEAPDASDLIEWLIARPLLWHERGWTMVHAGLPPQWSVEYAAERAAEVESALRSAERAQVLAGLYGSEPYCWSDSLCGASRLRMIANYFTRMRFCTAEGRLDFSQKGSPQSMSEPFLPWFAHANRASKGARIVFGHWSALNGDALGVAGVYPLDTGCIWGKQLSALCLEELRYERCQCP